ncbi:MAG: ATP synthase F1 subunit gamma [Clostridia bacterium]|nr:ATP synthase F1 subunit gamma [Clostridia bacterium]
MGADIKTLRNRIKSVDSTLHLTKAMGLVASSKIRRATENMQKSRQFEFALTDTVNSLTTCPDCMQSPYMKNKGDEKLCMVVIAGDRGLAGGYNANIFKLSKEYENADIIPIGKRACERFGKEILNVEDFSYSDALSISKSLCDDFKNEKYDKVGIIYTSYKSMMTQNPDVKWIFPLVKSDNDASSGIVFEPDEVTVLNSVITEYVAGLIISSVRESYTSEVVARRFAMDNAGKNATEMIEELQLKYNRARQGAITQEITEIVAGSGAQ